MSVFVDTGVFYAHQDTDAERHDAAVAAFDDLINGMYGQPYTSDYVFDETVTLTRVLTNSFEAANTVARRILGEDTFPSVLKMVSIELDDVHDALETFRRYDDHDLSFTDATIVSLCDARDIDTVMSFDSDFDGIVERIEPSL